MYYIYSVCAYIYIYIYIYTYIIAFTAASTKLRSERRPGVAQAFNTRYVIYIIGYFIVYHGVYFYLGVYSFLIPI